MLTTLQFESVARVLDILKTEKDDEVAIILDRTIFHPQGGGQPGDEGTISFDNVTFTVTGLKPKDDTILHIGKFSKVF